MTARVYSNAFLALFPAVYLAHLADERFFGMGTAAFATEYLGMPFSNAVWWAVNVPSMILLALASWLVARGVLPQWVTVALAVHLLLHGLGRVPTSLWWGTIAPGLITGLVLCTPLGLVALRRAWSFLPARDMLRGVAAGVLSFQPLWHAALLLLL